MFLLGSYELFQLILDRFYCSNKVISMIHRTRDCILNVTLVRQFFVMASCLVHCGYQIACLCHMSLAYFCTSWKNQSVPRYSILRTNAIKIARWFFFIHSQYVHQQLTGNEAEDVTQQLRMKFHLQRIRVQFPALRADHFSCRGWDSLFWPLQVPSLLHVT